MRIAWITERLDGWSQGRQIVALLGGAASRLGDVHVACWSADDWVRAELRRRSVPLHELSEGTPHGPRNRWRWRQRLIELQADVYHTWSRTETRWARWLDLHPCMSSPSGSRSAEHSAQLELVRPLGFWSRLAGGSRGRDAADRSAVDAYRQAWREAMFGLREPVGLSSVGAFAATGPEVFSADELKPGEPTRSLTARPGGVTRLDLPESVGTVLICSNWRATSRLRHLVWSANILLTSYPGLRVVFCGTGPAQPSLIEYARQTKVGAALEIATDASTWPAMRRRATCIWLVDDAEGWRDLIAEALAAGCPVLATRETFPPVPGDHPLLHWVSPGPGGRSERARLTSQWLNPSPSRPTVTRATIG